MTIKSQINHNKVDLWMSYNATWLTTYVKVNNMAEKGKKSKE